MSEAEAAYTRRQTVAKLNGRSMEEVENSQNRNVMKEVKKRMQVSSTGAGQSHTCMYAPAKPVSNDVDTNSVTQPLPLFVVNIRSSSNDFEEQESNHYRRTGA